MWPGFHFSGSPPHSLLEIKVPSRPLISEWLNCVWGVCANFLTLLVLAIEERQLKLFDETLIQPLSRKDCSENRGAKLAGQKLHQSLRF